MRILGCKLTTFKFQLNRADYNAELRVNLATHFEEIWSMLLACRGLRGKIWRSKTDHISIKPYYRGLRAPYLHLRQGTIIIGQLILFGCNLNSGCILVTQPGLLMGGVSTISFRIEP